MPFEAPSNTDIISAARRGARVYDNVHGRQIMLVMSKRLSYQPLDAIATDRVADYARSDRQSKPRLGAPIRPRENGKPGIGGALRVPIDAIEI